MLSPCPEQAHIKTMQFPGFKMAPTLSIPWYSHTWVILLYWLGLTCIMKTIMQKWWGVTSEAVLRTPGLIPCSFTLCEKPALEPREGKSHVERDWGRQPASCTNLPVLCVPSAAGWFCRLRSWLISPDQYHHNPMKEPEQKPFSKSCLT